MGADCLRGTAKGYFRTRIPGIKVCERSRLASTPEGSRGVVFTDGTTLEKPRFARDLRFSSWDRNHMDSWIQEVEHPQEGMRGTFEGIWRQSSGQCP